MRIITTTVAIAVVLAVAVPVHAGPLRESAIRMARSWSLERQPTDCQSATAQGEAAGVERQGRGGWFTGGFFAKVFFVPIMPIIAHASNPQAPASALTGIPDEHIECFRAGYTRTAKGRHVSSSWYGYAAGTVLSVVVLAALSDQ